MCFFFKQKTAYEWRISDWSSDVCSSDLTAEKAALLRRLDLPEDALPHLGSWKADTRFLTHIVDAIEALRPAVVVELGCGASSLVIARALSMFGGGRLISYRSEEHTSELQSLMRISYAVFCLKKTHKA